VRREVEIGDTRERARFAREWNFAFLLVAAIAALLLAAGHAVGGLFAGGLCVAAILARWNAMRRQNRGFYGQPKQAR
jgi:hypothetical protein